MYIKPSISLLFFLFISACSTIQEQKEQSSSPQIFRLSDGMEVGIIAPPAFKLTKEHYGFTQAESFSRLIISEIEIPFPRYLESLSKENLLINKLQLTKSQQVEIKGALCQLLSLREVIAGTYYEKLRLICGDNLSSVQVEASYPEGANKKHKQAIKDSLFSLSVATDINKRLFTGLPFSLLSTNDFTIKKRYANSIVLQPSDANKKSQSVVISHGVTKGIIEDTKLLNEHFLKNSTYFKKVEITKNENIKLNNMPALATSAYFELDDKPVWIYQVLVYQKNKFLLIQAQTPKEDRKQFALKVNELLKQFEFK